QQRPRIILCGGGRNGEASTDAAAKSRLRGSEPSTVHRPRLGRHEPWIRLGHALPAAHTVRVEGAVRELQAGLVGDALDGSQQRDAHVVVSKQERIRENDDLARWLVLRVRSE